jgi:hypothetical protein
MWYYSTTSIPAEIVARILLAASLPWPGLFRFAVPWLKTEKRKA